MDGYKCSSEIDRYINTSLKKRGWLELFLGSNTVTSKEKMFLTTFPSWITALFIAFVSQSVVEAAVCNFSVCKLIGLELFPT